MQIPDGEKLGFNVLHPARNESSIWTKALPMGMKHFLLKLPPANHRASAKIPHTKLDVFRNPQLALALQCFGNLLRINPGSQRSTVRGKLFGLDVAQGKPLSSIGLQPLRSISCLSLRFRII